MPDGLTGYHPTVDDQLLAEIAVRIQLPPSSHEKAEQRYHTLAEFLETAWSDRPGEIQVRAQGSIRIGATISVRSDAGHDVDATLDITGQAGWYDPSTAAQVLDDLYATFHASDRYRDMVTRNTRCVTITYADGMHIDLTPWLQRSPVEFEGQVMHHRAEDRRTDPNGRLVDSSPELFAQWFERQLPPDTAFASMILRESYAHDVQTVLMKEAEPIPPQQKVYEKPRALICLQLIKRFRNLRYESREGRQPPSILITKLVGDAAPSGGSTTGLLDELVRIVSHLHARLETACALGIFLDEENPWDPQEKLTDRWPGNNMAAQMLFRDDLREFRTKLLALSEASLAEKREILEDLFGETVGAAVVKAFGKRLGQNIAEGRQSIHSGGLGSVVIGGSAAAGATITPRRKEFFGD